MENNPQTTEVNKGDSFWMNALYAGVIVGIVLIIYNLILYMTDLIYKPIGFIGFLQFAILILGIVWATINYRNQKLGGYISYGKSLGYGVIISVFSGIVVGLFMFILYQFIDPDLTSKSIKALEEKLLNQGMEAEQVRVMAQAQEKFRTPILTFLFTILGFAFWGTILTLISSAFTKKDKPIFQ
jgi:hypothetical protein